MIKNIKIFLILSIILLSCNKYEKKEKDNSIQLVFVGDIMTHPTILNSFLNKDVLYSLKEYLKGDIVFANLEFVVNTNKEPSGYPNFNGSIEYLRYFFNYFNTFSIANNHAYDQGTKAVVETISYLERNNKLVIGGSTNSKDIKPIITNINNVNIFISSYTIWDNALSHRTNEDGYLFFINFFPKKEDLIAKVKSDLKLATNNEVKIVSLHFGLEYTTTPESNTYNIARDLIENGVDIIIGHHPHVPRPAEVYKGTNHSGIIVYSLGNFISNHKGRYPYLDIGTILTLNINNKKEISFSYIPTYYAFFREKGIIEFEIQPIEKAPTTQMPIINNNLYSTYDSNSIKEGYKLIHSFYSTLTNEEVKYILKSKN